MGGGFTEANNDMSDDSESEVDINALTAAEIMTKPRDGDETGSSDGDTDEEKL